MRRYARLLSARPDLGLIVKGAKFGEVFRKYLVIERPCSGLRLSEWIAGLVRRSIEIHPMARPH